MKNTCCSTKLKLGLCSLPLTICVIILSLGTPFLPTLAAQKIPTKTVSSGLHLDVSSSKRQYKKGEPLVFQVRILNRGSRAQLLYRNLILRDSVNLFFYDAKGRHPDFTIPGYIPALYPRPVGRSDFIELQPGFFFGREITSSQYSLKRLLPPGVYRVSAVLDIDDHSERLKFKHWHGEIWSNPIQFTIR